MRVERAKQKRNHTLIIKTYVHIGKLLTSTILLYNMFFNNVFIRGNGLKTAAKHDLFFKKQLQTCFESTSWKLVKRNFKNIFQIQFIFPKKYFEISWNYFQNIFIFTKHEIFFKKKTFVKHVYTFSSKLTYIIIVFSLELKPNHPTYLFSCSIQHNN